MTSSDMHNSRGHSLTAPRRRQQGRVPARQDAAPAGAANLGNEPVTGRMRPRTSLGLAWRTGAWGSLLLLALLILWAYVTPIGGAVIATGQAVVRGKPKVIQSLDGGIVSDIPVVEGQQVAEGQVLLRLDPTLLEVNRDIALSRLAEALARKGRLASEQAGLETPDFTPPALPFPLPDMTLNEEGQRRIFDVRRAQEAGRRDQLAERVHQFNNQIAGIEALLSSQEEQLSLLNRQIDTLEQLYAQGLTRESQLLELQRGRAGLLGEMAENRAEIARVSNSIRDAEISVLQADREFQEKVSTDLSTATTEADELTLQIVNTLAQLGRVELRSPARGVIHEMQVTTRGGVAAPGAALMQVIPVAEGVEFELKLEPRLIEQVHPGQKAQVVFPAFDQRTTPRLDGEVSQISPGTITDPVTRTEYYRLALTVPPEELAKLGAARIPPGMPVEAFLQLGDRTVLDYLIHPLASQIERSFRER